LLHDLAKIHATFDDPHLVSRAGLVSVMALAERVGLGGLVEDHLRHGAMPALFGGVRAPSTLGSFLRAFTWGTCCSWGR